MLRLTLYPRWQWRPMWGWAEGFGPWLVWACFEVEVCG